MHPPFFQGVLVPLNMTTPVLTGDFNSEDTEPRLSQLLYEYDLKNIP